MKQLDVKLYYGFGHYCGHTSEDEASDIDFSDSLYNKLKKIYIESGETYLHTILDEEDLTPKQHKELEKIIQELKDNLISDQYSNGNFCNPNTGEEYDFSDLIIYIDIVVPDEWEEC